MSTPKTKYFSSLSFHVEESLLYFAKMKSVLCLIVWMLAFCCAVCTQGIPVKPGRADVTCVNLPDKVRPGTRTGKASLRQEVGRDLCLSQAFPFWPVMLYWCIGISCEARFVNHLSFKFSFSLLQEYLQIFKATCGNYFRHKRNYSGTEKGLSKYGV